jgi:transketolase
MIIDSNNLQSLTTVDQTLSLKPLAEKVESFGWNVFEIDGHSFSEISNSLFANTDRPKCIIAKTVKGKGVSFMENLVEWHYRSPNNEMFELAMEELNA